LVIQLDCEGYEGKVIAGARKLIKRDRPQRSGYRTRYGFVDIFDERSERDELELSPKATSLEFLTSLLPISFSSAPHSNAGSGRCASV
jgi:hypothetical protein